MKKERFLTLLGAQNRDLFDIVFHKMVPEDEDVDGSMEVIDTQKLINVQEESFVLLFTRRVVFTPESNFYFRCRFAVIQYFEEEVDLKELDNIEELISECIDEILDLASAESSILLSSIAKCDSKIIVLPPFFLRSDAKESDFDDGFKM